MEKFKLYEAFFVRVNLIEKFLEKLLHMLLVFLKLFVDQQLVIVDHCGQEQICQQKDGNDQEEEEVEKGPSVDLEERQLNVRVIGKRIQLKVSVHGIEDVRV